MEEEDIKAKLLILFILDKYETPITQDVLLQICCVDNNWIQYFEFDRYFSELLNARHICKKQSNDKKMPDYFVITENGRTCLSYFYTKIFKSIREDVSNYITENKINYRKKQEFTTKNEVDIDGSIKVHCFISNGDKVILELTFNVDSKQKAYEVSQKWLKEAPNVYANYVKLAIDI